MSKSDWRSRVAMLSRTGSRKIEEMLLLEYYEQLFRNEIREGLPTIRPKLSSKPTLALRCHVRE